VYWLLRLQQDLQQVVMISGCIGYQCNLPRVLLSAVYQLSDLMEHHILSESCAAEDMEIDMVWKPRAHAKPAGQSMGRQEPLKQMQIGLCFNARVVQNAIKQKQCMLSGN
jgi:hypothetical protein